jgi:hypothetical protein
MRGATKRQRRTDFFAFIAIYCSSDATKILMRKTVERKANWGKKATATGRKK